MAATIYGLPWSDDAWVEISVGLCDFDLSVPKWCSQLHVQQEYTEL